MFYILAGATDESGYEHFQERVEGYQEMCVSLNRGSIQYILLQSKELIFTTGWLSSPEICPSLQPNHHIQFKIVQVSDSHGIIKIAC